MRTRRPGRRVEETVVESMRTLGLDPADIQYVIVSHAHNDHFGGAAHLQETYGARIVMSVEGNAGFRAWMSVIHDCAGDVLEQKLAAAR